MTRASTLSTTELVMRAGGCANHPVGFLSRAGPTGPSFAKAVPGDGSPFPSREPHDFQEPGKTLSTRESGSRLAVAVSLRFSLPIGERRSCIPKWTCRLLPLDNTRRTCRPVPASRQVYLVGCDLNRTGCRMTACSPQSRQPRPPHRCAAPHLRPASPIPFQEKGEPLRFSRRHCLQKLSRRQRIIHGRRRPRQSPVNDNVLPTLLSIVS